MTANQKKAAREDAVQGLAVALRDLTPVQLGNVRHVCRGIPALRTTNDALIAAREVMRGRSPVEARLLIAEYA